MKVTINKRTCTPFKMLGSWIGGTIGGLVGINITVDNRLSGCQAEMGSFGCTATLEEKLIGVLIGVFIGFLIGWGIHSLIKRFKK